MTNYVVKGYFRQPVYVEVEADTADEALEIGREQLLGGDGIDTNWGEWEDDFWVDGEVY